MSEIYTCPPGACGWGCDAPRLRAEIERLRAELAAEREWCARVCDAIAARFEMTIGECPAATCAAAIREGE